MESCGKFSSAAGPRGYSLPMSRLRFPIRFDAVYGAISKALLLPPSDSFVEVDGDDVSVRMAWAFRARFDRASVASISQLHRSPLSRGVHGFGGRWLVNGSGEGILVIDFVRPQHAYVLGIPIRLRQLAVSVEDPDSLAKSLTG